jgi:hypothetical protein
MVTFPHTALAALANGGGSGVATSGLAISSSRGAATVEGNGATSVGGGAGGGSLGRLQLKGVLDGLVKRSINEDK